MCYRSGAAIAGNATVSFMMYRVAAARAVSPERSARLPRMVGALPPSVVTLTLCESLTYDEHGRIVLNGILDRMSTDGFPSPPIPLLAYVEFEHGRGKPEIKLEIAGPGGWR